MQHLMTPAGFNKLRSELKRLKENDAYEVIEAIARAKELGDLKENAEYHAAKERQVHIENRIRELEMIMAGAQVVDTAKLDKDTVQFGHRVTVMNHTYEEESIYYIVGPEELDDYEDSISYLSPLGKAIIGHKVGDQFEVLVPAGTLELEVLSIN